MTRAQAEAHQRKHGFVKGGDAKCAVPAGELGQNHTGLDAISTATRRSNAAPPFKPKGAAMNKTEAEYALILEAMKRRGEILRYEYEGITLRWADMKYTPDFIVFGQFEVDDEFWEIKLIEVKGGHIWDRDIVRFKGARAYWPEFQFEMYQKKQGQWRRLH